jgi:hypothetical protein
MRRLTMMLLPAVAMAVLPAGHAWAASSLASCTYSWTDTASPGIGATPSRSQFTSNGQKWPLACQGLVRGSAVTGTGTFGEDGLIDGSCSSGSGEVNFSFTIPTAAGAQKFRLTFPFVYGPGGGTARTDTFPGVFVFLPKKGDCINAPVTEFEVHRTAILLT